MISFVLAVKILVLLPGIPSVSFNVRKRLLATAVPLVVIVSWIGPRLARPGDSPVLAHARIAPSSEQESQSRLASLGRKLSLLEQQLDRLGVKAPSGSGGRGGPEVPITLAMLDQDADTLHERVKSLFSHREALRAQFRRRYAIDVPLAQLPIGLPLEVAFDYTSGFGVRADPWTGAPTAHNGVDLAADYGAPIMANAPGRVLSCQYRPGYGLMLEIDHGGGLVTRYAHLSACRVQAGAQASRGQPIASVGNSGRSTGPHLHYEVLIKGRPIDPAPFIWLPPVSPS
jgi:murein DD-endopeptidase MepM/ murein hydrolase activator NlpD